MRASCTPHLLQVARRASVGWGEGLAEGDGRVEEGRHGHEAEAAAVVAAAAASPPAARGSAQRHVAAADERDEEEAVRGGGIGGVGAGVACRGRVGSYEGSRGRIRSGGVHAVRRRPTAPRRHGAAARPRDAQAARLRGAVRDGLLEGDGDGHSVGRSLERPEEHAQRVLRAGAEDARRVLRTRVGACESGDGGLGARGSPPLPLPKHTCTSKTRLP